jgi:nucleoside-diphosphate-sugar epimerase
VNGQAGTGDAVLITGISALVSGATGFLGGHLAESLHRKGYRVRALVRRTSDAGRLVELGIETAEGDLSDTGSLVKAAQGMTIVFHTAGKVSDWGSRQEFFRDNVEGTANVIAACLETGVARLVYAGSLTVLGLPRTGERVDEESPPSRPAPDPYTESKMAGENLVRAAHGRGRLAVTVIRSGVIWGPGELTILPRIAGLLRRGLMVYIDGGRNLLGLSHVENLTRGMIQAAEAPAAAGQIYHLTDGEEITAREAIEALAGAAGVNPPRMSLPFRVAYGASMLLEGVAHLTGRKEPPLLTRYGVRLMACDCRYDTGKARRELDYQPLITFREGIATLGLRQGTAVT